MSPLREPVDLPDLDELGPTHFIAIGGAGMSGIASLLAQRGVAVSGSDQADSEVLRSLADHGVTTFVGHDASQLGSAQTVVVSSAIREQNVELAEARRRGLRVLHRSAALAVLLAGHRDRIAVAGTHGKTTTTAMVAQVLSACGTDPSYVIGGTLAATGTGARLGAGEVMVVEADESDGTFLQYDPNLVVVTNIEADHLDNWGTESAYAAGFTQLVTADPVDTVVLCADDPGTARLAAQLTRPPRPRPRVIGYGEAAGGNGVRLTGSRPTGTGTAATVDVGGWLGTLELAMAGQHNVLNAAAALAVAVRLGLDLDVALAALAAFTGTARRFQTVAEVAGARIIDDYAHHPTELAVNVAAGRTMVPVGGRLVVCFQPHLFTRTRDFAAEFGQALSGADVVVVLGVYPAREDPIPGVTGRLVAEAVPVTDGHPRVHYVERVGEAAGALAELVRPGDVVLTVGAGDVTTVASGLAALLEQRMTAGER